MAERLHYFTEASTPVSFDCSDSDIDSDLDDLSRRPISESDRAKVHARQMQLWSDEARRRRSPAPPPPAVSPRRRPSSVSQATPPPMGGLSPGLAHAPPKMASPEMRGRRISADRQQSNLSERTRLPNSRRVSRSHSAKNLRIRITPSSSSKSLLSDIESELGNSVSAPQSPRGVPIIDAKVSAADKTLLLPTPVANIPEGLQNIPSEKKTCISETEEPMELDAMASNRTPDRESEGPENKASVPDNSRGRLTRRMSFSVRGRRFPSLRKFLRR